MSDTKSTAFKDYIVVGAGTTGATAAHSLRTLDDEASILLIGDEAHFPYHRPALSKLSTGLNISHPMSPVLAPTRYESLRIELERETQALALDRENHRLTVRKQGETLSYEYGKLLIATGARPTPLRVRGAKLGGVHYLRTFDDARRIAADCADSQRAVVIGASFIGMEIAGSLLHMGLEVTLIEQRTLLYKLHHPVISDHFDAILKERGVQTRIGQKPVEFEGTDRVQAVITDTGERIECDLVVIGAGVIPNTLWLKSSGLTLRDGVLVNEFLQTNDPDIYAAGDVANAWHQVFRRHLRIEHWDNAITQGKCAARNMTGKPDPYSHISYFYSHVFDQSYNALGLTEEKAQKVERGSPQDAQYETLYLENGICQGFLGLGRAGENARAADTLIRDRVHLHRYLDKIRQPTFALSNVPGQVVFILQGGGAYGAFECGAIRALKEEGIVPDLVAGVSIGAFNAAIVASAREHAAEALDSFWHDISTISFEIADDASRRMMASNQIAAFGVPGFFSPRWMQALLLRTSTPDKWTSFYDFTEARDVLEKYVDFPSLATSPVRLLVTAIDVQTSEIALFDSHVETITADHILASGSLPPAFSWTTIDGRHYWDAGIISNSPLEMVLERVGSVGKQIYLIDLFTGKREHLPQNIVDVYSRREEIIFSERLRHNHRQQDLLQNHRRLIEQLLGALPQEKADVFRSEPLYQQLMGRSAHTSVTRIMRESTPESSSGQAYDFSRTTILQLIDDGYQTAKHVLKKRKNAL